MKIRALVQRDENSAQYHWRIDNPFRHLRLYGIDADVVEVDDEIPGDTDIVVLPKIVPNGPRDKTLDLLNKLRENGAKIVYEVDDDMWSESYVSFITQISLPRVAKFTPEQMSDIIGVVEERRNNNLWILRQCDAAIVSTDALKEYVQRISLLPVFTVKNAIDVRQFTDSLDLEGIIRHPHYTTIGWAGGCHLQADLTPMLDGWETLAKNRDDVKFVIAGWQPDLSKYPGVKAKLIQCEWTDVENYATNMQVDIGCVCVGDSDFSSRKSTIKAWEYAIADAFVIGSHNLYHPEPIITCKNGTDWYLMLNYFVEHEEERLALADVYRKHVKSQYDLEFNWLYWADAYQKILAIKESANALVGV